MFEFTLSKRSAKHTMSQICMFISLLNNITEQWGLPKRREISSEIKWDQQIILKRNMHSAAPTDGWQIKGKPTYVLGL